MCPWTSAYRNPLLHKATLCLAGEAEERADGAGIPQGQGPAHLAGRRRGRRGEGESRGRSGLGLCKQRVNEVTLAGVPGVHL